MGNDILWLGAFRYYLGRQTYAVSDFVLLLEQNWNTLSEDLKVRIEIELKEAFQRDDLDRYYNREHNTLGSLSDRREWEKILNLCHIK